MSGPANLRSAPMQQWQAYLTSRMRRHRDSRFLVHGVDLIAAAHACEWPIETLLYRLSGPPLSRAARELLDGAAVPAIGLLPDVIAELATPGSGPPELVAVARSRAADLATYDPGRHHPVLVVLERPAAADELGTVIRDAAALGASAVVVVEPGADQLEPECVRATAGALFRLPVFRVPDVTHVARFRDRQRRAGLSFGLVGIDDTGASLFDHRFEAAATESGTGLRCGTMLVAGRERLTPAGHDLCDAHVRPIVVEARATRAAVTVALYEIARQRAVEARR